MSSCCCSSCCDDTQTVERRSSFLGDEKAMHDFASKFEYVMVFKMVGPPNLEEPGTYHPFSEAAIDKEGLEGNQMPDQARKAIKSMLEAKMEILTYLSKQKDELYVLITTTDDVLEEFADDKDYLMLLDKVGQNMCTYYSFTSNETYRNTKQNKTSM